MTSIVTTYLMMSIWSHVLKPLQCSVKQHVASLPKVRCKSPNIDMLSHETVLNFSCIIHMFLHHEKRPIVLVPMWSTPSMIINTLLPMVSSWPIHVSFCLSFASLTNHMLASYCILVYQIWGIQQSMEKG